MSHLHIELRQARRPERRLSQKGGNTGARPTQQPGRAWAIRARVGQGQLGGRQQPAVSNRPSGAPPRRCNPGLAGVELPRRYNPGLRGWSLPGGANPAWRGWSGSRRRPECVARRRWRPGCLRRGGQGGYNGREPARAVPRWLQHGISRRRWWWRRRGGRRADERRNTVERKS